MGNFGRLIRLSGLLGMITSVVVPALLASALLTTPVSAAPDRIVTDIRVARQGPGARLVVDIDRAAPFKMFALANPPRVVVDMPEVGWRLPAAPLPAETGIFGRVRYGLLSPGASRMVIDLMGPARVTQAFVLPGNQGTGQRLVIDMQPAPADIFRRAVAAGPVAIAQRSTPPPIRQKARRPVPTQSKTPAPAAQSTSSASLAAPAPTATSVARVSDLPLPRRKPEPVRPFEKRVVVLDPGHGGADPGAIGVSGRYEKHITLAAAREIKRHLESTGRFKVVVTRDRDVFIKLGQRVKIAREHGADLFISLHADTIRNTKVRGPSVYTLSEKASDKEAAALAERENKADLIDGVDLSAETREVTNILIDLAQRESMNRSSQFAALLVDELKTRTKVLRNTHRFAGFRVLKAPDIPSVLVEMGFLSNRTDERQLASKAYRKRIADAVKRAAIKYFDGVEQARLR